MGEFNFKSSRIEGQLSKFTNVIRGYQFRYFVVNSDLARLDYYISEELKHQKPRGTIELKNAVISPSEEDSTTFTIHTFDNESFKLRAQDARERQHWLNVLRYVSQLSAESEKNLETRSSQFFNSIPLSIYNETLTNNDLVKEVYNQVKANHQKFEQIINELPAKGSTLNKYDKDILILKATAKACVVGVSECCNILRLNQKRQRFALNLNGTHKDGIYSNQINNENFLQEKAISKSSGHEQMTSFMKVSPQLITKESHNSVGNCEKSGQPSPDRDEETDEEDLDQAVEYSQLFEDNKSQILQVLPNLTKGMDLTKVSFPTFLLEKRSLLEMYADCIGHVDLLTKINDEKTAEDRMLAVLDWYLSCFHQLKKMPFAKKPYNPIIGETFSCSWRVPSNVDNGASDLHVNYVSEQVSHHPAISAFYVECKQRRMKLNANILTKSKYLGMSISVQLVGELILRLEKYNEEYIITLPSCYARSIVTKPWIELVDKCSLSCAATGYHTTIDFLVKTVYGEKSNQINAEVKNKNEETICKIKGDWNGILEYEFASSKKMPKTVDISSLKWIKKRVKPLSQMDRNESRRVWHQVSQALQKNDVHSASQHKHQVEKLQRANEKLRREQNIEFKSKCFQRVKLDHDALLFSKSLSKSNAKPELDLDKYEGQYYWLHKNW